MTGRNGVSAISQRHGVTDSSIFTLPASFRRRGVVNERDSKPWLALARPILQELYRAGWGIPLAPDSPSHLGNFVLDGEVKAEFGFDSTLTDVLIRCLPTGSPGQSPIWFDSSPKAMGPREGEAGSADLAVAIMTADITANTVARLTSQVDILARRVEDSHFLIEKIFGVVSDVADLSQGNTAVLDKITQIIVKDVMQ